MTIDHLITLYKRNELDHLRTAIEECMVEISDRWLAEDIVFLDETLPNAATDLSRLEASLADQPQMQAVMQLGQLYGVVRTLSEILYEERQDNWAYETYKVAFGTHKHLLPMIEILSQAGELRHADLAKRLGIKPSTLTSAYASIRDLNLIGCQKYGKFAFYSLTDLGRRVASEHLRMSQIARSHEEDMRVAKALNRVPGPETVPDVPAAVASPIPLSALLKELPTAGVVLKKKSWSLPSLGAAPVAAMEG